MKIAHLAEFAPHQTGLYGTTKDLIFAEIGVGIDAVLVDAHLTKDSKVISRPSLKDGDLPIRDVEWAKTADILVHHSIVHQELRTLGIPIVLAIHGRPESTFLLEHIRHMPIFGGMMKHGQDPRYKAFFTFWQEYMYPNCLMVPREKLFYVPAPVDLKEYTPEGNLYAFVGSPNILIADMWREDVTPFNVIMAAGLFKQKYAQNARVHIIGAAPKKSSMQALAKMLKKDGVLGEVHPRVTTTALCYRGADMVVTPHSIATRVVRESLACGTPIVAGTGNRYTEFTADSRDPEKFAEAIDRCWRWIKSVGQQKAKDMARAVAEREFNPEKTGAAAKVLYEKVLENEKIKWTNQDGLQRKTYATYADYLVNQMSKLDEGIPWLEKYDKEYRVSLRERLLKSGNSWRGKNVVCMGARTGTEVKAFLDVGCFAVGVDLNPGKDNKYVVTGDFHNLVYPSKSVDVVFTNSLDHVYRIRKFLGEVSRVLAPKGLFIVELEGPKDKDADKWASLHWNKDEDLIGLFKEFGLALAKQTDFESLWFRKQLVFQLGQPAMMRFDLINRLIKKRGYKRYLEIGVRDPEKNFDKIICAEKSGIDPNVNCTHRMTSDEFFARDKTPRYDVIFVDGLHTAEQAEKDILNSLNLLNPNGTILVHDCNPPSEKWEGPDHCGMVWKAWAKLRMEHSNLSMCVIDTDYGCGILRPGGQIPFEHKGQELTYNYLAKNRKALLNLISVKDVESWV